MEYIAFDAHKGRQVQTAQKERWCLTGLRRRLDLWSG